MNRTIYIWIIVIILWIISDCAVWSANYNNGEAEHGLTYSRESLLLLQNSIHCSLNPDTVIPSEIRASLKRKRGRQGGVRCRLRRRPYRPPLPSIILANVRSLRNKMDLLHAKCLMGSSFREACVLALCETWLDGSFPDSEVSLDGFRIIRANRSEHSGKVRGRGVCMFVNSCWCTNIKIHSTICNPDLELLTLSARAFYLPSEFSTVVFTCVYVPPSANVKAAAEQIAQNAHAMLSRYLLPVYKQQLKQHRPVTRSTPQWTEDTIARLQGCFACTDWEVFEGELEEQTSVITSYIKFCIDTLIPVKTIRTDPNSKPWITPKIQHLFKKKNDAFRQQNSTALKIINQDIKNEIIKAKLNYKLKLEQEFANMNTKQAFQGVRTLTGQATKQTTCASEPITFANDLNHFYARFDTSDFSAECASPTRSWTTRPS